MLSLTRQWGHLPLWEQFALGFPIGLAIGALLLWLAVLLANHQRPYVVESERTFDREQRARELGYDPDACARGEHPWYVSWGFCANPFCQAVMPGLVRRNGQPTCPECDAVTTLQRHRDGCTIGEANWKLSKLYMEEHA